MNALDSPASTSLPGAHTGLLLVNLGTPASPRVRDVRRYLREFLSDPRVLTMSAPARWMLLNLVILPFRPRKTADAYSKIWTKEGSPLLLYSQALAERVTEELGDDFVVELAMRYQQPSIGDALARLQAAGVERVLVVPLFPQFADAVTNSVAARVEEESRRLGTDFDIAFHGDFFDDPGFIEAQASKIRPLLEDRDWDHVLFSYHGLPESQIRVTPGCLELEDCCEQPGNPPRRCYRAQCFGTTRALSQTLDLTPSKFSLSFQSRLTREPWIRPYTDFVLPELYEQGKKSLLVVCPAFTADNLETLEEVGIRLREQWLELGGENFALAECANDSPIFAGAIANWTRDYRRGA
ncbi:MAG: ferrochelatase [Myxococcota bacterium]|nr:ferrochelatase [Myxococcota bacterium]